MTKDNAKKTFEKWRKLRFPGQEQRFRLAGWDAESEVLRVRDLVGQPSGELDIDLSARFLLTDILVMETLN